MKTKPAEIINELVHIIHRAMLNTRNDAIILGSSKRVTETQWWKDAEAAVKKASRFTKS